MGVLLDKSDELNGKHLLRFTDRYEKIHALSTLIYDRGVQQGLSSNQIAEEIRPYVMELKHLVEEGVEKELGGVMHAVIHFKKKIKTCQEMADYYTEKMSDLEEHILRLEGTIAGVMEKKKVDVLNTDLYRATRTRGKKGVHLTIR